MIKLAPCRSGTDSRGSQQLMPRIGEPAFRTGLTLGALVTWRLTHLLAKENGPGDVLVRLRSRLGDGQFGHLMDCFQCLSVWVAGPVAMLVAHGRREIFLTWLGLSGAACLVEQAASHPPMIVPLTDNPEGDT
jgi:hypothetical protein